MSSAVDTIGVIEAAKILRCSETTLMRRARLGIVPGAKPGREWVFIREDLINFLRENYKRPCSIAAATVRSGGVVSSSMVEKSASQLALELDRKLKNSKPKLAIVHGGKQNLASDQ